MAIWLGTIDCWIVTMGISELTAEEIPMTLQKFCWTSTFHSLDTLPHIFNKFFVHFRQFWKSVLHSGQGLRGRKDVTSHPGTDLVLSRPQNGKGRGEEETRTTWRRDEDYKPCFRRENYFWVSPSFTGTKFDESCYQIRKHDIFQCKDETHNLYFSHDRWNLKPRMNRWTPRHEIFFWMELLLLFHGTYSMHSMKNYL